MNNSLPDSEPDKQARVTRKCLYVIIPVHEIFTKSKVIGSTKFVTNCTVSTGDRTDIGTVSSPCT